VEGRSILVMIFWEKIYGQDSNVQIDIFPRDRSRGAFLMILT
jgi:hypothetical protein